MIFERPQRLRAVKIGIAAAIARLEESKNTISSTKGSPNPDDVLATAIERLKISEETSGEQDVINVVMSTASVDILSHPAVKFVHGDVDGDVYLERLVSLVRESEGKVARGESEIPEDLSQTDLYRKSPVSCRPFHAPYVPFGQCSLWRISGCYSRSYWYCV